MSALQQDDRVLIQDSVDKFILDNYSFDTKEQRHAEFGPYGGSWSNFAELGWLALPFSESAGGLGGGVVDVQVLMRAFGKGLISEPYVEVALLAGKVLEYGAKSSRLESLLAPLIAGESMIVLAHGEDEIDFSYSAVKSVAQAVDNGYVINAVKKVVPQAGVAQHYLVTAMLDNAPALFLLPRDIEGLQLREYTTIDSRMAGDLYLSDVRLGPESLIASGSKASTALQQASCFTAAALVGEAHGIAKALTEITSDYMRTREQFGTTLNNFQALQHMFADMVIAEEELDSLAWMLGGLASDGDIEERERSIRIAKARVGIQGIAMAELAVQLHGGIGVTDEYIVGHYLRRMLAIDVAFGDSTQQMLHLADRY